MCKAALINASCEGNVTIKSSRLARSNQKNENVHNMQRAPELQMTSHTLLTLKLGFATIINYFALWVFSFP